MPRRAQIVFLGWFLAIVAGIPFSQAGIELGRGQWPQALAIFRTTPTQTNLRAYEKSLETESVFAQAVRPRLQAFWFRVLGQPGEKAVIGKDGWLFYKQDVRYLVEGISSSENPVAAISSFHGQLAQRGVRLLVIPMPGKPHIYPDRLTRRIAPDAELNSPTGLLITQLRASGIETLDLREPLSRFRQSGEVTYLPTDTHWSARAARYTAELTAHHLQRLGWIEQGSQDYDLRPMFAKRRGDILQMMNFHSLEQQFPYENVPCDQVVDYQDDPQSSILVLGDSFLRIYQNDEPKSAGFIAHLARALKMPLASIVNDGGASTLVRQELSRKPALLAGKRVVIWEFAERDIRFGTEGWKRVELTDSLPRR